MDEAQSFSTTCIWYKQQSGAEEACWAHNPEVGGSKPLSAMYKFLKFRAEKQKRTDNVGNGMDCVKKKKKKKKS